jgi:hypothetical protein
MSQSASQETKDNKSAALRLRRSASAPIMLKRRFTSRSDFTAWSAQTLLTRAPCNGYALRRLMGSRCACGFLRLTARSSRRYGATSS